MSLRAAAPEFVQQSRKLVYSAGNFIGSFWMSRVQWSAQKNGQRSIVIVGARRSGHHAVIFWIANSLEEGRVQWHQLVKHCCFITSTNRTIHLNNWKVARHRPSSARCLRFRKSIRKSEFVLVNYEDQDPADIDRHLWLPQKPDLKILVTRSTLNLVASRLEKGATSTKSRFFPVDEPFFEMLKAYRQAPSDWIVIDFDSWLRNEDGYRSKVAERAGLATGVDPEVSQFGGGSSFTGLAGVPAVAELTSRFTQVEWPERVVKLLLDERFSTLLTPGERDFLQSQKG